MNLIMGWARDGSVKGGGPCLVDVSVVPDDLPAPMTAPSGSELRVDGCGQMTRGRSAITHSQRVRSICSAVTASQVRDATGKNTHGAHRYKRTTAHLVATRANCSPRALVQCPPCSPPCSPRITAWCDHLGCSSMANITFLSVERGDVFGPLVELEAIRAPPGVVELGASSRNLDSVVGLVGLVPPAASVAAAPALCLHCAEGGRRLCL